MQLIWQRWWLGILGYRGRVFTFIELVCRPLDGLGCGDVFVKFFLMKTWIWDDGEIFAGEWGLGGGDYREGCKGGWTQIFIFKF